MPSEVKINVKTAMAIYILVVHACIRGGRGLETGCMCNTRTKGSRGIPPGYEHTYTPREASAFDQQPKYRFIKEIKLIHFIAFPRLKIQTQY